MSDIHGHKEELDKMLKKIRFSELDDLYILGDIVDKGPESAEMLIWAVDEAPSNVHFLLGNHEDMMASCVLSSLPDPYLIRDDPWGWNGGDETLYDLKFMVDNDWFEHNFRLWVENLPLHYKVSVNERPFMLVHAGFNPKVFDRVPLDDQKPDFYCDALINPNSRQTSVDVGWGFGIQYSQDMLWERETWLMDEQDAPITTIFGHTIITSEFVKAVKHKTKMPHCYGGSGKIAHIGNKIGIDCGCARSYSPRADKNEKYNLACLRLDDMREYYVPCRIGDGTSQ